MRTHDHRLAVSGCKANKENFIVVSHQAVSCGMYGWSELGSRLWNSQNVPTFMHYTLLRMPEIWRGFNLLNLLAKHFWSEMQFQHPAQQRGFISAHHPAYFYKSFIVRAADVTATMCFRRTSGKEPTHWGILEDQGFKPKVVCWRVHGQVDRHPSPVLQCLPLSGEYVERKN